MACFSGAWIVQLLVSAAVLAGIYMIVTYLLTKIPLGEPFPSVVYVLKIVMWVIITVWVIYFCADLISCAFGGGTFGGFPRPLR